MRGIFKLTTTEGKKKKTLVNNNVILPLGLQDYLHSLFTAGAVPHQHIEKIRVYYTSGTQTHIDVNLHSVQANLAGTFIVKAYVEAAQANGTSLSFRTLFKNGTEFSSYTPNPSLTKTSDMILEVEWTFQLY